jgi:hypothetical protein
MGPGRFLENLMTSDWHQTDWDRFWYWKPAPDRPVSKKICWVLDSLASPLPGKWVGALAWMKWEMLPIGKLHPEFVRFLLELLASGQTRCRGRILDWLGCLCRWKYEFGDVEEGEEVEATRVQVETLAVLWSGLDTLLALLDDERLSVRTSAPFPVAMLLHECREQLPPSLLTTDPEARIVAAFDKRLSVEANPIAKASVVIATGYVAKTQPQLIPRLRALHLAESNTSVRLASALALAVGDPDIPDEAVELLAGEVRERPGAWMIREHFSAGDVGLEARHNPLVKAYARLGSPIGPAAAAGDDAGAFEEVSFPWTNSDWPYLSAVRALCLIKPLKRRSAMEAITHAVSVCRGYQSGDVVELILPVLFPGRQLSSEATRADLTEWQYTVLRAIYDNPLLWPCGNTNSAFGSVTLPVDRKSWRRLLEIKDRPDPAEYYERLVRSHENLPVAAAVTEEHYRRVLVMCLHDMVDNRFIPLLTRFPMLESLEIQGDLDGAPDGFAIDGEGVSRLPVLPRMTHLYIRGVDVIDIPPIEHYHALMLLDLPGTHVGDRFIGRLAGLPKLACVYLWETRITDACLQVLPALPSLISLDVCKTAISDDGIEMLAKLTPLQNLRIHQTNITEDGYRRLQGALPRCKIEWSGRG